jgi:hypothetical protein
VNPERYRAQPSATHAHVVHVERLPPGVAVVGKHRAGRGTGRVNASGRVETCPYCARAAVLMLTPAPKGSDETVPPRRRWVHVLGMLDTAGSIEGWPVEWCEVPPEWLRASARGTSLAALAEGRRLAKGGKPKPSKRIETTEAERRRERGRVR